MIASSVKIVANCADRPTKLQAGSGHDLLNPILYTFYFVFKYLGHYLEAAEKLRSRTVFLTSAWGETLIILLYTTEDMYSKTANEAFSVLIDGVPGWLSHKQTFAFNNLWSSSICALNNGMHL